MTTRNARWAVSFADLCLLLLGFLLILQAKPEPKELATGMRAAFAPSRPSATAKAATLFEPGEAILTEAGQRFAADFARSAGTAPILVSSAGTDGGAARFDGWELAAARAAALARALVATGVPEGRILLQMDRSTGGGQRLGLEVR